MEAEGIERERREKYEGQKVGGLNNMSSKGTGGKRWCREEGERWREGMIEGERGKGIRYVL